MIMHKNEHVQYILLAEFDIDKGANLKHQYPTETGTDEHILSELMLPDGAHLRSEDWTIFCLNQLIPNADQDIEQMNSDPEKPLLYVLNLVRTKHDATARRGAIVKAMAICTRHQYLHIYKPVLLLAMEKYFNNPSLEILESLYKAVNSMDLSHMPKFTWHERQILRASDNRTMFEEMFMDKDNVTAATTNNKMLIEDMEDNRLRRGTYIDLASGHVREKISALSKDRHFYETKIEYDGIKLPIKIPLTVNAEEVGDFSVIKLINTFTPHHSQGSPNPHHPHLDSSGPYTHPIILLLNALLTQKRIIFLGYGHPSGEVANYVLAACALGSGCGTVLKGFTERAFPYTNLTSVDDLLKCPGFIAGVTNPTYEEHTSWWDVLCNISTGKITVSEHIQTTGRKQSMALTEDILTHHRNSSLTTSMHYRSGAGIDEKRGGGGGGVVEDSNVEFMNDVIASIQAHYGETSIRAKFQDYIYRFVRLAALYEEQVYGQTNIIWSTKKMSILGYGPVFQDESSKQRELCANAQRIEGWRQTISYKYYQRDFNYWKQHSCIKDLDVYNQINKLKKLKQIPDQEIASIYEAFLNNIITHRQMIEFLSFLPQHQGGLSPLGIGLFHSNPLIRRQAVDLFRRLERNPVGIKFIQNLSKFQRIAYERQAATISVVDQHK
ncbi:docking domain of Afi1 for Arf3 in vesicle trafficking-domain-containing protein [Cokeromyces recurvatus]|uniref:docking domain of Afi1 for Arf3 in vesicle trafficking-domain-containing protein n=1 Tax=Cokeromyces recurvatus TaxID=90255 RepID=UPI00221F4B82|nr:docking domain of Afi1 for Arf3 in vesicle trafficking-domain-containing protein [Cokeromyces recurvatus]KAI7900700.1 docking domain of Afi1 for Arf3 in vesicle trafficking-domain-containing protein [Cokeromyces recurvatus]